jgi:hypothetical protein
MTTHAPAESLAANDPWVIRLRRTAEAFSAISLAQSEIVLSTGGFLSERVATFVHHGTDLETLSRRLNELTDRYLETCAAQWDTIRRSWIALFSTAEDAGPRHPDPPDPPAAGATPDLRPAPPVATQHETRPPKSSPPQARTRRARTRGQARSARIAR